MWVPGGMSSVDTQSSLRPLACLEPLDVFARATTNYNLREI